MIQEKARLEAGREALAEAQALLERAEEALDRAYRQARAAGLVDEELEVAMEPAQAEVDQARDAVDAAQARLPELEADLRDAEEAAVEAALAAGGWEPAEGRSGRIGWDRAATGSRYIRAERGAERLQVRLADHGECYPPPAGAMGLDVSPEGITLAQALEIIGK